MQILDLNDLVRVPKSALIEHCARGGGVGSLWRSLESVRSICDLGGSTKWKKYGRGNRIRWGKCKQSRNVTIPDQTEKSSGITCLGSSTMCRARCSKCLVEQGRKRRGRKTEGGAPAGAAAAAAASDWRAGFIPNDDGSDDCDCRRGVSVPAISKDASNNSYRMLRRQSDKINLVIWGSTQ